MWTFMQKSSKLHFDSLVDILFIKALRLLIHSEEFSNLIHFLRKCRSGTSPKNTKRGRKTSYSKCSTIFIQTLCNSEMLPHASAVLGEAGPDDSEGSCWSCLGLFHETGDYGWECVSGRSLYMHSIAEECLLAQRNHWHPHSLPPLAQLFHNPTWLLQNTPSV